MGFRPITEGVLTADGSEQVLFSGTGPGRYSGYIDFSSMVGGDVTIIREYILINGIYKVYHTESYTGMPTDLVLSISPKESISGVQLTLQQTAGILRDYAYQFIVEEIIGPQINI
jgi:hypothetical protein